MDRQAYHPKDQRKIERSKYRSIVEWIPILDASVLTDLRLISPQRYQQACNALQSDGILVGTETRVG